MRLIDADALKKAFESWKNVDDYYHDTDCGDIPFSEAYDLIDNSPTIERPQGEWEDYSDDFYKCPECGYLLNKNCPRCMNKIILPNCGARMIKEAKNEINDNL